LAEVAQPVAHEVAQAESPSNGPAPSLPEPNSQSPRRLWLRRFLVLAILAVGLYLCRSPILRGLAGWLVITEPAGKPTAVLLLTFDGFAPAAELRRAYPDCQVVVVEYPSSRLVQMGILPARLTEAKAIAQRIGIPESTLSAMESPSGRTRDVARQLDRWLAEHPDAELVVYCSRFDGRRLRFIFNAVLKPEANARVHVQAVQNGRYDETNWWQVKEGKLSLFNACVALAHAWWEGDNTAEEIPWNPDQYERTLPQAP
jgi:hypothetical protein